MDDEKNNRVEEPSIAYGHYSYADYLTWPVDLVAELIQGKLFKKAAAAPNRIHQRVSGKLAAKLYQYLEGKTCEVYAAPFDVRFTIDSKDDHEIFDVVQPDLCVVCDPSKLDERGCIGAPDLIIEILSPGSTKLELKHKYELYESRGVREYWVIHPDYQDVIQYTLVNDHYLPSKLMTSGDVLQSKVLEVFSLDLEDFFADIE